MGSTLTGNYDVCVELADDALLRPLIDYAVSRHFPQQVTINATTTSAGVVLGNERDFLSYVGTANVNFTPTSPAIDTRSPYCLLNLPLDFTVVVGLTQLFVGP